MARKDDGEDWGCLVSLGFIPALRTILVHGMNPGALDECMSEGVKELKSSWCQAVSHQTNDLSCLVCRMAHSELSRTQAQGREEVRCTH